MARRLALNPPRWRRVTLAIGIGIGLLAAACSGPGGANPTATATLPPTATARATAAATATVAPSPPTETPAATATATTPPTPTATIEPTATATVVPPTPTATVVPLPSGGAEMTVVTKAISSITQGNAAGSVLYAVTSVGVSRSADGGRTWVAAGDTPDGTMVAALNNPDVIYAGAHGACAKGASSTPLTRSTDGGQTWETFQAGVGIQPLLVMAGQHSIVLGTNCRLTVSTTGGQSWITPNVAQNFDIYAAASSFPDALDGPIILLGVSEGGTGTAWIIDLTTSQVVTAANIVTFYGTGAVAWHGQRIVIATSEGVVISNDSGQTWTQSRAGLESVTYSVDPLTEAIPAGEQSTAAHFTVVRIHPDNPDHIWIGGTKGAFESTDGGQTWSALGDHSAVDSLVVASTSGRVYISANGGTRAWAIDKQ